jgi:thymidylate synthase ThyX
MTTAAKLIADSLNALNDDRLITLELTFPRIIQAQLNTYRESAKNSASSRAKSMKTVRYAAINNYFEPEVFMGDNRGMFSMTTLSPLKQQLAHLVWTSARLTAVFHHKLFSMVGVHKEISNRVLEPYLYTTVVMTASFSSWEWLLRQRLVAGAQPQFRELAKCIKEVAENHKPRLLKEGDYHLPYVTQTDKTLNSLTDLIKLSIARCAAVSYKTFDGTFSDDSAFKTYQKLYRDKHLSPFEHVATPSIAYHKNCYNVGWKTERNILENS